VTPWPTGLPTGSASPFSSRTRIASVPDGILTCAFPSSSTVTVIEAFGGSCTSSVAPALSPVVVMVTWSPSLGGFGVKSIVAVLVPMIRHSSNALRVFPMRHASTFLVLLLCLLCSGCGSGGGSSEPQWSQDLITTDPDLLGSWSGSAVSDRNGAQNSVSLEVRDPNVWAPGAFPVTFAFTGPCASSVPGTMQVADRAVRVSAGSLVRFEGTVSRGPTLVTIQGRYTVGSGLCQGDTGTVRLSRPRFQSTGSTHQLVIYDLPDLLLIQSFRSAVPPPPPPAEVPPPPREPGR